MIFEGTSLDARLRWLVRLRWIAVVAVVATIAGAWALDSIQGPRPLFVCAAILAGLNLAFTRLDRNARFLELSAAAQVVSDMLVLTFLLHFAGGSGNPFAFFYVFHVIIASILFSPRAAYLTAVLAILLYGGLTAADLVVGTRHPIAGHSLEVPRILALGRLGAFAATVGASAFFGSTIMGGLRSKQAELRESHDRLAQAEKLAAIGQLAAGIAHELNTPLGSILVAAEVTKEGAAEGSEAASNLTDIVRETKRCKEITRSLLDFSRKRTLALDPTDVGEVVRQSVGLVRREAGTRAACIAVEIRALLPTVRSDAGALGQVVVNVVKNALDAVDGRDGARVTIGVQGAGPGVVIRIADNGRGIAPADLAKIFEPFFTTKAPGKGTGLGLSLSYSIMHDLKGEIEVTSEEGKGTTVSLRIPG